MSFASSPQRLRQMRLARSLAAAVSKATCSVGKSDCKLQRLQEWSKSRLQRDHVCVCVIEDPLGNISCIYVGQLFKTLLT